MELHFDKYSAHGNDFILIDDRAHSLKRDDRELFSRLCRRRFSVGADGIILIGNEQPDFTVEFINADGLPVAMCGNGSRAAVDFARRKGLVSDRRLFWVRGREHKYGWGTDDTIGVEIHRESSTVTGRSVTFERKKYGGFVFNSGVPHIVFFDREKEERKPYDFVRAVRFSPEFHPGGVNVNLVSIENPHSISIMTYERGVEDFTLSCGTGAVAAVYTGLCERGLVLPVTVHAEGGDLTVSGGDDPESLWIWGTVDRVCSGVIDTT